MGYLSVPGLVATGVFAFMISWNAFLEPLILTYTEKSVTVPVVASMFASGGDLCICGPFVYYQYKGRPAEVPKKSLEIAKAFGLELIVGTYVTGLERAHFWLQRRGKAYQR